MPKKENFENIVQKVFNELWEGRDSSVPKPALRNSVDKKRIDVTDESVLDNDH